MQYDAIFLIMHTSVILTIQIMEMLVALKRS